MSEQTGITITRTARDAVNRAASILKSGLAIPVTQTETLLILCKMLELKTDDPRVAAVALGLVETEESK